MPIPPTNMAMFAPATAGCRTARTSTRGVLLRSSETVQTQSRSTATTARATATARCRLHRLRLAGEEQDEEQSTRQDERACHVHVSGAAFGGFGHGAPRGQEGDGGDEQAEAVGGPHPAELGEQRGQRVADAGPDDGDHRDQGDRGRAALLGKMVAGHAHHQRRQTEPDALGRPADEQPRERQRQHGERAAGDDDRQRGENRGPPVRAGSEPAEDGRGDGAAEQRDGQRPLRAVERDVERGRHAGDERRPEAGDRRHDQGDEHQGGDQQPRLGTRHRAVPSRARHEPGCRGHCFGPSRSWLSSSARCCSAGRAATSASTSSPVSSSINRANAWTPAWRRVRT